MEIINLPYSGCVIVPVTTAILFTAVWLLGCHFKKDT